MTHWTETYRGIVPPWECDMTEHFTIAYYFDRLADASALLGRALGLSELARGESRPGRLELRFLRELRAGASFHILSGPLGVDETGLRLAHRFVDSASGETIAWVEEVPVLSALPPQLRETVSGRLVSWEGPPIEPRPEVTWFVISFSLALNTRRFEITSFAFCTMRFISASSWLLTSPLFWRTGSPGLPRETST
jgi:acyl-CoA thioesterase FadM